MSWHYGKGLDGSAFQCCNRGGSATSLQVDSAWVYGTSGEAVYVRFTAPYSQTSGAFTLYAFCTAITGTPVFSAEIRNGAAAAGDPDRPEAGGAALGTFGSTVTPTANRWATFTWTNLTLVEGQTYFAIIYNSAGSPTTNHATWMYRGALDSHANPFGLMGHFEARSGQTANGFTTDPTTSLNMPPFVWKFDNGAIMGFPYVSTSNHPSDSNDRGYRVQFSCDIEICGFQLLSTSGTGSLGTGTIEITNANDNSLVKSVTLDAGAVPQPGAFFSPTRLSGGIPYNIVITNGGASNTYGARAYMGETDGNLPVDVKACRPGWMLGWVGGATSPGSYTLTEGLAPAAILYLSDNPSLPVGRQTIAGRGAPY